MRSKKPGVTEDFLAQYKDATRNKDEDVFSTRRSRVDRNSKKVKEKKEENYPKKKKKLSKKQKIAKNTRKRKRRKWPYIIIILLLLISASIALAYSFLDSQVDKFNYLDTKNENFGIANEVEEALNNYESFAILGLDARSWEDPKNSRADSIIIATLNKETGDIDLTSVMRDTTLLMTHEDKKEHFDKATHSHVYGGPMNTVRMLNKGLDLNIKKFVVLTWKAVGDMIDEMGGVEVEVHKDEIKDMNKFLTETATNLEKDPVFVTKAGVQKLDGAQAVTFCRIRETSGGDVGRGNRTKIVMSALLKTIKENPLKITKMTDKAFPSITTNMNTTDFVSLLPKATKINIRSSNVYPHEFWHGIVNEAWIAIPTDLITNAKHLHKNIFQDVDYAPSKQLKEINRKLKDKYGPKKAVEVNE